MLKKTITYTDYDGNVRTETFHFNLSTAELAEMELKHNGGMTRMIQQIVDAQDAEQLTKIFKDLILNSYGEKSLDGKHFIKSPELSMRFSQTEAYSIMFMELINDDKAAANFVNSIIPEQYSSKKLSTGDSPAI